MGHVFVAEHTALQKRVALKILAPQMVALGDEQSERFLREARAGSRLSHPGIVEINDFGTTDTGLPFFAMELLEGEDLGDRLDRDERLAWPVARDLTLQMLDALSAAHAEGVVHRDLKPENCFLTQDPSGAERLKLVDFGIAKLLSEPNATTLTADGRILGTPHYMAPEQAIGKDIDARADVYASTIILFEMLTGQPPFNEGSVMEILSQHLSQPPPSLREAGSPIDIPDQLEAIVAKGLAKAPEERFASVDEFAAALRALTDEAAGVATGVATDEATAPGRSWGPLLGALVVGGGLLLLAVDVMQQDDPASAAPRASIEVSERGAMSSASADASAVRGHAAAGARDDAMGEQARTTDTELGHDASTSARAARDDAASTGGVEPASTGSTGSYASTKPRTPRSGRRHGPRPRDPASSPKPTVLEDAVVERHLEAALAGCRKWGGPAGATLQVRLSIADSGDVSGTTIAPPYAGDHPLGRCAARHLNQAVLPVAEQQRDFTGTLRVSGSSGAQDRAP